MPFSLSNADDLVQFITARQRVAVAAKNMLVTMPEAFRDARAAEMPTGWAAASVSASIRMSVAVNPTLLHWVADHCSDRLRDIRSLAKASGEQLRHTQALVLRDLEVLDLAVGAQMSFSAEIQQYLTESLTNDPRDLGDDVAATRHISYWHPDIVIEMADAWTAALTEVRHSRQVMNTGDDYNPLTPHQSADQRHVTLLMEALKAASAALAVPYDTQIARSEDRHSLEDEDEIDISGRPHTFVD